MFVNSLVAKVYIIKVRTQGKIMQWDGIMYKTKMVNPSSTDLSIEQIKVLDLLFARDLFSKITATAATYLLKCH